MPDAKVISAKFCSSYKGIPLIEIDLPGSYVTFTVNELRALGGTLIQIANDSAKMDALRADQRKSTLRGDYVVGE